MSTMTEIATAGADQGTLHVAAGQTNPGAGWKYDATNKGLFIDVDTSSGGFGSTPVYVVSLQGAERQWATTGGCCVYFPTSRSFRVYVKYPNEPISEDDAVVGAWQVNWIGVSK